MIVRHNSQFHFHIGEVVPLNRTDESEAHHKNTVFIIKFLDLESVRGCIVGVGAYWIFTILSKCRLVWVFNSMFPWNFGSPDRQIEIWTWNGDHLCLLPGKISSRWLYSFRPGPEWVTTINQFELSRFSDVFIQTKIFTEIGTPNIKSICRVQPFLVKIGKFEVPHFPVFAMGFF